MMTMQQISPVRLSLATVILALAACGGGGGEDATSSSSIPVLTTTAPPAITNVPPAPVASSPIASPADSAINPTTTPSAGATSEGVAAGVPAVVPVTNPETVVPVADLPPAVVADPVAPPVELALPTLTLDKEFSIAVSEFGFAEYQQDLQVNPDVDLALSRSSNFKDAVYTVASKGGTLKNGYFFSDLKLAPQAASFFGAPYVVGNFAINEYKATQIDSSSSDVLKFGIVLPNLTPQFKVAGIGLWRYVGPRQTGYYIGIQAASGSFAFGSKSPATVLDQMSSSNYSGYAQSSSLGRFSYNMDDFSQNSWTTNVQIDKAAGTITFSIRVIKQYLMNDISVLPMTPISLEGRPSVTVTCTTPIVLGSNSFTCILPVPHFPHGSIRGRFFGETGEEIAGTFHLNIWDNAEEFLAGGHVGAFVVKR